MKSSIGGNESMKRMKWILLVLLLAVCTLLGYKVYQSKMMEESPSYLGGAISWIEGIHLIDNKASDKEEATNDKVQTKAERLLEQMTLEEKIGQLFIVRPSALQGNTNPEENSDEIVETGSITSLDGKMKENLKHYKVGGVALFADNIVSPEQLADFTQELQMQSNIPLFIAVDEEGGKVSRLANSEAFDVPQYESMQKIGLSGSCQKAEEVGLTIGSYLKEYGFNLDFAPVADINTNPENIVIGDRAFGSNPELVAQMVSAEISGLHEAGIMSCIKHFPGHGDTKGDTHEGYVSIEKTWDALKACELIPFIASLDETDMVMIAHITTPNITSDNLPASLSSQMIEEKLRGELGYQGVVITDAMEMGAITKAYSSSESAVKAILAGGDIILMPKDFINAYEGIYTAVKEGRISEERIDKSVLIILNLKTNYYISE